MTPNSSRALVSACIPSFNHEGFLPTAIESVLAQTYGNIELIIVDDGSNDGSLAVARSYAARYPTRVRVFSHEGRVRRGISATVNAAIKQSAGDYWCGLGSDDAFVRDRVERQVRFLERHPDVGLVYGSAAVIDECGRSTGERLSRHLTCEPDPLRRLVEDNVICAPTVMVRRHCFDVVGLFDDDLMYSDWEMWIRVLARYKGAFLPATLAYYRKHAGNSSLGQPVPVHRGRQLDVLDALRRKADVIGGGLARPAIRGTIELQRAYLLFCAREEEAAAAALEAAFALSPCLFSDHRFLAPWLRRRQSELALFADAPRSDFPSWFQARALALTRSATGPLVRFRLHTAVLLARSQDAVKQTRQHIGRWVKRSRIASIPLRRRRPATRQPATLAGAFRDAGSRPGHQTGGR